MEVETFCSLILKQSTVAIIFLKVNLPKMSIYCVVTNYSQPPFKKCIASYHKIETRLEFEFFNNFQMQLHNDTVFIFSLFIKQAIADLYANYTC